ncbi:transglutaminase-like cysteine peptidase, partial [Sphingomonas solaris]
MHWLRTFRPTRPFRLSPLAAAVALAVTGAPALADGGSAMDLIYASQGAATMRVAPAMMAGPTVKTMAPATARRHGGIFGSIAIAVGRTPLEARFRHAARSARSGAGTPWHALLKAGAGQGRRAQAQMVNAWVNRRVQFANDAPGTTGDRWASLDETVARGRGDCEDYAIAKLQLLAALGVPTSDLMLVIARDLVRRADHAVLV